jgi:hypothetical protein
MSETTTGAADDRAADFERVYAREIAPHADDMEAKRQGRVAAFYRRIGLSVPLVALAAGALYTVGFLQGEPVWSGVILVVAAVAAIFWISRPAARHREELKDLVIAPVCRFLGDLEYSRAAKGGFDTGRFEEAGVVGHHNRTKLEDLFTGHHRGTGFRVVEARLRRRRRRRRSSGSSTVFKGLLFEIEVPTPFSCRILLTSDKGGLVNRMEGFFRDKFGDTAPVAFDHAGFEARYEVYSDDAAAARALMTPALLDSLVALCEAAEEKALRAAFADGRFLLALPNRKDLFEIGKLHRSLEHLEEDVRGLLAQVTLPHRVIDYLHGERPGLMV